MMVLDTVYSTPGGIPLAFDLVKPDSGTAHPLVICIHGGGWISGDRTGMRDVAENLAAAGFAAACPSYRLAPLHPFPAAVEDIRAFVTFCQENAKGLGLDAERMATLGNSAGGHLAAMAALGGDHGVRAVVDICGISDVCDPRAQHFPISWAFLEQFMQVPFEGNEDRYREASPIHQVMPGDPPFFLIHGEDDDIVPVEQSHRLHAKLQSNGVHSELGTLPNEGHSFSYEGWMEIERRYLRFLREQL